MVKYNIKGPRGQAPWGRGVPPLAPPTPPLRGNKKSIYFFDKKFGFVWQGGYPPAPVHPTHSPYACHIPVLYILIFVYVCHTCSSYLSHLPFLPYLILLPYSPNYPFSLSIVSVFTSSNISTLFTCILFYPFLLTHKWLVLPTLFSVQCI